MADNIENDEKEIGKGHILEEFKEIDEIKGLIDNLKDIFKDQVAVETTVERFTFIIDKYQEQPHLIDRHLESLMTQLLEIIRNPSSPIPLIHLTFKCLYLITKMRGAKVIVRLFPHEVADVEPVIALLTAQDPKDYENWETRYELLLWMSMVSMIPFDMVRLDSNVTSEDGKRRKPAMDRILDLAKLYLTVNDKSRDAAAYLASRFMTRPDVQREKLPDFLDWSLQMLHTANIETMMGVNCASGTLRVLSLLFKHGKREDLLKYAPVVKKKVEELKKKETNNTLLRKSVIKVIQRLGLTFLKNRVAAWRYQRGSRSLADNLSTPFDKNNSQQFVGVAKDDEDEEYDIPDEIEDVIEHLLGGLRDKDTIVRWSAAKGIGRITGRLPKELADEVVGSVLELFTFQETDGAWHGGCLSLAELGRRGLLLPQRLPDVVPVVLKALDYDEKRGNFSVGAHVRDSACYVCWAFARAYDPQEIAPYVNDVANALVKASIFDREVNVRRAASAAFQENVGRQGTFPHGIDILTMADYFAVGNRNHCYLELSIFVAKFPEYTKSMIDHLVDMKINHWDGIIRDLSAQGLHKLTSCSPDYMASQVLPKVLPMTTGIDLYLRHGAILAVAEITHALSKVSTAKGKKIEDVISKDVINDLKNIAVKLTEAKMFRGYGGDFMRRSVSCLIEKLSLSKLPYYDDPVLDLWQNILDECLGSIDPDNINQTAAASAIPAFFTEYYKDKNGGVNTKRQETVIEKYLHELKSSVETTRMGYSQAIGAMPGFFIKGKLRSILQGLMKTTEITEKEMTWAESRREALKALNSICNTVGVDPNGSSSDVICKDNLPEIYDSLFIAMRDYTLDSRGDVGAWVREASMTGLHDLTSMVVNKDPSLLSSQISRNIFCCLLQQACEKIDRTRAHAGLIFSKLLYHKPEIPNIPHREELEKIFPKSEIEEINWAAPSDTFPRFSQLLGCESYAYNVLLGFTVSVGGITESLVKFSSTSMETYLRKIQKNEQQLHKFTQVLIQIFKDYLKKDRVSIPLLKMLDQLLSKGSFDVLATDASNTFPIDIFELTKKEILRSGDPHKLMASADVFCGLLHFSEATRKKSLTQLLILVCHKYPRVRKTTANKLYEALVTYDDVVPDEVLDDVMTMLSETVWDNDLSEVRKIRNDLCDMIGILKPVVVTKSKSSDTKTETPDR